MDILSQYSLMLTQFQISIIDEIHVTCKFTNLHFLHKDLENMVLFTPLQVKLVTAMTTISIF
jgi:hypothetical protein